MQLVSHLNTITLPMTEAQPFSQKFMLQLCLFALVVTAIAAGYYEVVSEGWQGKYERLAAQQQKRPNIQISPSPSPMEKK